MEPISDYMTLKRELIEEAAKALFFEDIYNQKIDQRYYDIWFYETEPNASVGQKIRWNYMIKALKNLVEKHPKIYSFEHDTPEKEWL